MIPDRPTVRPEPGYEVTDIGEALWELYVRTRNLNQMVEHYAVASDRYYPAPAEEFVFVTNAVAGVAKWAARAAAILAERAA